MKEITTSGGLTLEIPGDWNVRSDASGRVDAAGPGGEAVTVWPFFVQAPIPAGGAGEILRAMAAGVWPDAAWQAPAPAGPEAVTAWARQGGEVISGLVTWTSDPGGSAGFAFFASAPGDAAYRANTDRFAAIMKSVRLQGAPDGAPDLIYEEWQDPNEQAFRMELPAGWRTRGGALRPALALVQSEVAVSSPDDQVRLWFGDHFPMFMEPNPMLAFAGMGRGGTYMDGTGYRWLVQPYAPGAVFLYHFFLPARLGQGFEVTSWQDLPQLAGACRSFGINRFDAGEVYYRFTSGEETYNGHAIGITEVIDPGGGNRMWHLWRLFLCEAVPARMPEAEAAMAHAADTFAINPWWAQMQSQITANQSRIIAEMGNAVSNTIHDIYEYKRKVDDEISRRRENANLFTTDVIDPTTGRQLKVEASGNYYWINHRGQIVGTQTATVPGVDFRSLIKLP